MVELLLNVVADFINLKLLFVSQDKVVIYFAHCTASFCHPPK